MSTKYTELQAKFFRGLADQSRLCILETIVGSPKTVSEIVKITKLSQPNTSLHLACLLECGLVSKIKKGREVFYKVSMKEINNLISQTKKIIRKHSKDIYKCTHYVVIALLITTFAAFARFYTLPMAGHCSKCITCYYFCDCNCQ